MHVVINISEELYKHIQNDKVYYLEDGEDLYDIVKGGIPLPKGHGEIKDVSKIEIPMCEDRTYERWVQVAINSAQTIIEADRSEE